MSLMDSLIEDDILWSELKKPVDEVFIAIRTDGRKGDGTRFNPFNGSSAVEFDQIFAENFRENVIFRLGPGLFRTQGAEADSTGGADNPLVIASGAQIIGAGMFSTVLRLSAKVRPLKVDLRTFSVIAGTSPGNFIEISDLTIDCALGDQPKTTGRDYALMCLKAIELAGTSNRVRRVRIINFGSCPISTGAGP